MAERPLLILPAPGAPVPRGKLPHGGKNIHLPGLQRQRQRLQPRFDELQKTLDEWEAHLHQDTSGIVPEDVLVLETSVTAGDFVAAVGKLGMEWLGEIEEEDIPPDDDFFEVDDEGQKRPDKSLRGRTFMVFSNQTALRQFLPLWRRWLAGESFPHGQAQFKTLFQYLRDVHLWGAHERLLETGIVDDWQERLKYDRDPIPCEIELGFRKDPKTRAIAQDRVAGLVRGQNGKVLTAAVIEEIPYHALLAELPAAAIEQVVQRTGNDLTLIQCEQIQFFRATGQMGGILTGDSKIVKAGSSPEAPSAGDAVAALFDGLPIQNHACLAGRLIIDDPDRFEDSYPANERRHGTSMASLILHGDLSSADGVLPRPLYVRPILRPDERDWRGSIRSECVPGNILAVDLLHRAVRRRAVRRLFEGEGTEPPVAPSVCIINLSVGILDRPFEGSLSPLARLIDWLAWKYKVLFIVSAGNHMNPIDLGVARSKFSSLDSGQRQAKVLKAIAADSRNRRLLSPAESTNALIVGAAHDDTAEATIPNSTFSPYQDRMLPSPINAQGMGFRRAIKPDLLASGGRVVLQQPSRSSAVTICSVYDGTLPPGQLVAAPGSNPGDVSAYWYTRGTSNATALTTRSAVKLYAMLQDLQTEVGGAVITSVPLAIWLKVLLGHSAEWGTAGAILEQAPKTPQNGRQFKEYVTRLLGYGVTDDSRCTECTEYRVTALGGDRIGSDQSHVYRFPLPPSLSARSGLRRLKISLAWLSPVNPSHQDWRRAALWFEPSKQPEWPLHLDRQQAEMHAAKRGTIQHEVFEGRQADPFVDGECIEVRVSCRAAAGILEEDIPYALAITLEVGEEVGVPIPRRFGSGFKSAFRSRLRSRKRCTLGARGLLNDSPAPCVICAY